VYKFGSRPLTGETLWGAIPSYQTLYGCSGSPGSVTVTTPGYYGIQLEGNGYRYSGSYVSLYIGLARPDGTWTCSAQDNLPAGGGTGYFTPKNYCIEHLDVGVHSIPVGGSDASSCGTSSLYMVFTGTAKLTLLQAD